VGGPDHEAAERFSSELRDSGPILDAKADEVRTRRATGERDGVRDFTETRYAAKSWPLARMGSAIQTHM
jgi:hypothetical protein